MRIKELRKEHSMTQTDLAKILGVNQSLVGKYERGEIEPNLKTLINLSALFEVSIDFLVENTDDFGNIVVPPSATDPLTDVERDILDTFRKIPNNIKDIARNTLHSFVQSERNNKRT